jgi:hypothetical protein
VKRANKRSTRLVSAGAKGSEPEDIRKRLVVVGVHPTSVYIASAHAPEPVALDNDAFANRRQNCVNDCRCFIV